MQLRGLIYSGVAAMSILIAVAQTPWVPVKSIEFSSRHDVLIRNFDGTLSRMDEPWYQAKMIAPGTWQLMSDGDFMYLVEGDSEALMIDAGYGVGNIREFAQGLTKKPLRYVANTHLHFDHTANDGYFDKAFMSQGTKDGLPMPSATFTGVNFPRNYPIEVIGDGYTFHLGNRDLEAILLGNHTPGGTAYLDRKQRILFVGDEIMAQQGIAIHLTVAQFEKLMEKLAAHRKEFDTLCAGWEMMDATWVDKYLALSQYILAGNKGLPASEAPPAPLPTGWPTSPPPVDPSGAGRTVYFRHVPRGAGPVPPGVVPGAGQAPAAGRGAPNPNIYRTTYGGATVTYDVTKVQ